MRFFAIRGSKIITLVAVCGKRAGIIPNVFTYSVRVRLKIIHAGICLSATFVC